jgi:hypothetical protein
MRRHSRPTAPLSIWSFTLRKARPLVSLVCFSLVLLFRVPGAPAQISEGGVPPSFYLQLARPLPTVQMPAVDTLSLLAEDARNGNDPYRFAAPIDVALNLKNAGQWEIISGGRLWRMRILSSHAYSIGLLYDDWYIPKGGRLFIYNDDHSMVVGAFTDANNWDYGKNITQHITGDAIILEYFEPVSIEGRSRLSIYNVCHAYRNLFGHRSLDSYGASAPCEMNVNCPPGDRWLDEKRGVGMIIHNNTWQCSGSLINAYTPLYTVFPYFLTANHCWQSNDALWIFYFNYESPVCGNQNGPLNQTIANAHLVARWDSSDFALYQLSSPPPAAYNVFLNGWSREDVAADSSVGIHHPMGDIKKISFDQSPAGSGGWRQYLSCTTTPTHWKVRHWEVGETESGSSGSPLFDAGTSLIKGQLSGICGNCDCIACSSYYGKLSKSWEGGGTSTTRLKDWLDPTSSGILGTVGQYFYWPDNDACPGTAIAALPFMGGGSTTSARNDWNNCVGQFSQDVFYYFTPSCDMTITVSLCGSNYNTGVGVFYLPLGNCTWPFLIACNDNSQLCADTTNSQVTFDATMNCKYLFDIHGAGLAAGNYLLSVTGVNHVLADSCPGLTIPSLPYTHSGDTRCSTNNYHNCVGQASPDEVFTYTSLHTQVVVASLCGSGYNTALEVRTHGPCRGDSLVKCNDDGACWPVTTSKLSFRADSGRTYYLIVHGNAASSGTYQLQLNAQPDLQHLVVHCDGPLILLNWPPLSGATVYYVYRDTTASVEPSTINLIGTTSDTSFVDPTVLALPSRMNFYVVTGEMP